MNELFKAQEMYNEFTKLEKEIKEIESKLDKAIQGKCDGYIELGFETDKKEKLKLDEDGSIVTDTPKIMLGFFNRIEYEEKENKETFTCRLSEKELILMYSFLLRHKQEKRKLLIKDFNDLSLKLKIK